MNGSLKNDRGIFLRTFDLPDIHFASVNGPDAAGNDFIATRISRFEDLDTIALNRWYSQSLKTGKNDSSRDCWLEINGEIYMVWGAKIVERDILGGDNAPVERWEFSFNEMKRYSAVC